MRGLGLATVPRLGAPGAWTVLRLATLAVSCRWRGFIARPRAQPSGAPAPCIGNPRQSASSRNSAAVAAPLPLLAYYPRLAAPGAHRARRLALRHALHSALGLRPRRGALRLLRSSLRSPNLIAFGDRRILPSLRSALTSFGGYLAPRHDLTWGGNPCFASYSPGLRPPPLS